MTLCNIAIGGMLKLSFDSSIMAMKGILVDGRVAKAWEGNVPSQELLVKKIAGLNEHK